MFHSDSRSLFKRIRLWTSCTFWTLFIGHIAALICSYYQTYLFLKLVTHASPPPSLPALNGHSLDFEVTEYNLNFIEFVRIFWNSTAYLPALALIASLYTYPYFKCLCYLLVFVVPLRRSHQYLIAFWMNQLNKGMFVPLIAGMIMCVTFTFDFKSPIALPSTVDNILHIKAEAYPGKGLVLNIVITLCSAILDYALLYIIRSERACIVRMCSPQHQQCELDGRIHAINEHSYARANSDASEVIQRKYVSQSWIGLCSQACFVVLMIANIWLNVQAIFTATTRFKLCGVLAWFAPDIYVINDVFDSASVLFDTPLLQTTLAWFIYVVYLFTLVVCPCVVCVLIVCIWLMPLLCANKYAFGNMLRNALDLLWFVHSWNALDVYLLCQFGASNHNIESATKYLIHQSFPHVCGTHGIVPTLLHTECAFAKAHFTYALAIMGVTVLLQWFAVLYTNMTFCKPGVLTLRTCSY